MSVGREPDPVERALTHVNKMNMVTVGGIAPGWVERMTRSDVEQVAIYAGILDDISTWVIADLLLWAETRAREEKGAGPQFYILRRQMWDELLKLCKRDWSYWFIMHAKGTAAAFPHHRRRNSSNVSFEHHRLLSGRSEEEQEHYLDMAESMNLSAASLRYYMQGDQIDPVNTVDEYIDSVYSFVDKAHAVIHIRGIPIECKASIDEDGEPVLTISRKEHT